MQAAFGRPACAEPSVVQETLEACTAANVVQRPQAMDRISRQHSRGYRHDYPRSVQGLDADRTGRPCGKKAACAPKGSCAQQRHRRGRQLGRVLATRYTDIVVDRLFGGTTQLTKALRSLVQAAEQTLERADDRRRQTLWRLAAGGGSGAAVNGLLKRGDHGHCKDYSGTRAQPLAASVPDWGDDPRMAARQVGGVSEPAPASVRPVRRLAVRCRKQNGQWGIGVLRSTLVPEDVMALPQQPVDRLTDPPAVLLAYVSLYDQRGGGVETAITGEKQGLGLTTRNKQRFEAQQMLIQLGVLAHNTMGWTRHWLTPSVPWWKRWGIMRLVRDVCQVSGRLGFDSQQHIVHIILNAADPLAKAFATGLNVLLEAEHIAVTLGEI